MAGKNHIERSIRVFIDDGVAAPQDLSADVVPGTLQAGGVSLEEVDMTGISNTIKRALGGYGDSPITARFYMNDTATTGAFTVLKGREGSSGTITIEYGQSGNAPIAGDPKWSGEYTIMQANAVVDGGRVLLDCRFIPQSGAADPAWGIKS